jgi:hypothetical protein
MLSGVTTGPAAAVLAMGLVAVATGAVSPTDRTSRPVLTIVGDSVAAALQYPNASRYLRRAFRVQLDAKVCRRLVGAGCAYRGQRPTSALQAIAAAHDSLGAAVVIDVGYNDPAASYRRDLDRVMRALVYADVTTVVWTTLRYWGSVRRHRINESIREAADRWPQLRVADWNTWSRQHRSWFIYDGLHLNSAGAMGLARLISRKVPRTLRD